MPLDLQLHRIHKLLSLLNNPHHKPHFIHVAGTNGKGSVCSYISHVLTQSGIDNGKFNSPHLLTPRDSIQINNVPVSIPLYEKCKKLIANTDRQYNVGCTEFELLTCTAFQIFVESSVPIAILEVGVGGRLDATNVIPADKTIVVGVTKVGLDHQSLLGNTLAEIAYQKVGIFKKGVPAVIDGSNDQSVLKVAEKESEIVGCPLVVANRVDDCWIKPTLLGDYQWDNLAVALKMIDLIKNDKINKDSIEKGIAKTIWPGRLQKHEFNVEKLGLPGNSETITLLLDGAHNTQAAVELGKYLDSVRQNHSGFVFVIAITKGKDLNSLFRPIIKPQDTVIFTQFEDNIQGMPWIEPTSAEVLRNEVNSQSIQYEEIYTIPKLKDALKKAYEISNKQIVVCGSLYLIADVLRL